jgi:hypothetical protein
MARYLAVSGQKLPNLTVTTGIIDIISASEPAQLFHLLEESRKRALTANTYLLAERLKGDFGLRSSE